MPTRKATRLPILLASAIVMASIPAGLDLSAPHGVQWLVAFAEKGGSSGGGGSSGSGGGGGGGSSGNSGSGGNGGGSSGSGSGGDGGSSGGGRNGGGGSSNSGSGSSDGGSEGASGRGGGDDNRGRTTERGARRDAQPGRSRGETRSGHASVSVSGANIEVTTEDGFRQKIEGRHFEMKDPMGRTIVRRSVTAKDRARLSNYLR